jgi:hypothetical protein
VLYFPAGPVCWTWSSAPSIRIILHPAASKALWTECNETTLSTVFKWSTPHCYPCFTHGRRCWVSPHA